MYTYRVNDLRVIDGDTVEIKVLDLGFNINLTNQIVRLNLIDTPETHTKDPVEKYYGNLAKTRLSEIIDNANKVNEPILLQSNGTTGKYGRIIGDLLIADASVSKILIHEHLAVAYHGQNKRDILEEHLKNRNILISKGLGYTETELGFNTEIREIIKQSIDV